MDKKEKVLHAGMEIIIERGLERTPMSMIAERAEVGMGTVYRYFENKEDIINGIYIKLKEEEAEMVFVNQGISKDVKKTFLDYYGRMIDHFLNNPLKFSFIGLYAFSPIIKPEIQEEAMSLFRPFDDLYRRGRKEGLLKNIKAEHMTYFVFSAIAYWIRAANELNIEIDLAYKNMLLKMAWDSIKK